MAQVAATAGAALILFGAAASQPAAAQLASVAPAGGSSGLPVPRFVSLKSDRVNMRTGPGTEYPTQWVYRRAGLPVEVIKEFEGWRQVRDAEGAVGWVLAPLLSGRRTVLVEPWQLKPNQAAPEVALRSDDSEGSAEVARLEAGVIASVKSCDGRWCAVSVGAFRGYLEQRKLWGVYKDETGRW